MIQSDDVVARGTVTQVIAHPRLQDPLGLGFSTPNAQRPTLNAQLAPSEFKRSAFGVTHLLACRAVALAKAGAPIMSPAFRLPQGGMAGRSTFSC
jgi:hypothetical protein